MSTDLNALFDSMNRGDVFAMVDQLFPRTAVSSAIPSSEVAGTGQHSLRETAPEDLGGVPPADRGPATVGVLYPVTCAARYYDAASRILEDEGRLAGNPHNNANELGALIEAWIHRARNNWEPK